MPDQTAREESDKFTRSRMAVRLANRIAVCNTCLMTTTETASDTFTDAQWDAADRIVAALETKQDLTLAKVLKAAALDRRDHALAVIAYLIDAREIATSGNGAWTHYHPRG